MGVRRDKRREGERRRRRRKGIGKGLEELACLDRKKSRRRAVIRPRRAVGTG